MADLQIKRYFDVDKRFPNKRLNHSVDRYPVIGFDYEIEGDVVTTPVGDFQIKGISYKQDLLIVDGDAGTTLLSRDGIIDAPDPCTPVYSATRYAYWAGDEYIVVIDGQKTTIDPKLLESEVNNVIVDLNKVYIDAYDCTYVAEIVDGTFGKFRRVKAIDSYTPVQFSPIGAICVEIGDGDDNREIVTVDASQSFYSNMNEDVGDDWYTYETETGFRFICDDGIWMDATINLNVTGPEYNRLSLAKVYRRPDLMPYDCTIECSDNIVETHKFVLIAASDVLEVALTSPHFQQTNEIKVDAPEELINTALALLYGVDIEIDPEEWIDLLVIADMWDLKYLRDVVVASIADDYIRFLNLAAKYKGPVPAVVNTLRFM